MGTIIRKAYWNHEKEEKWLNEMSAKGLALAEYSWCRYVFSDCQPGEYIYRIELLQNVPSHPESMKYLDFMGENGVEHITSYMRWVYFRKKAVDGVFDIYSDIDSKIKHYQRINLLWMIIAIGELLAGLSNIMIAFLLERNYLASFHIILGCITTIMGIAFISIGIPTIMKVKKLKTEKNIRE